MYLSELKLWNFRKYGIIGDSFDTAAPGLTVTFKEGVNVLVGENDSGKTTIIDAIRYALRTQSGEFIQFDEKDFHQNINGKRASEFKIECLFDGLSPQDCGLFWEWIELSETTPKRYVLRTRLYVKYQDNTIKPTFSVGSSVSSETMDATARELLKIVYLKPLRDALSDMTHGYKSRLAQILSSHPIFQEQKDEFGNKIEHQLELSYKEISQKINNYFSKEQGSPIVQEINDFLTKHFLSEGDTRTASVNLTGSELSDILRQLDLVLSGNKSGLGTLNLLCVAAELLLLKNQTKGLRLALIEELEAHLHPQHQLRLIEYIINEPTQQQFILTTHSITLASKVKLKNLIIVNDGDVYPMGEEYTGMTPSDYNFIERFLDATKANMFFAKGVIMVEGDAENLLIPAIAEAIGRPLHRYGISIVKVGSKAYRRYASLYSRKTVPHFSLPISIIADIDVRCEEYYKETNIKPNIWAKGAILDNLEAINKDLDYGTLPKYISSKEELKLFLSQRWPQGLTGKTETIKSLVNVLSNDNSITPNTASLDKYRLYQISKIEEEINRDNVRIFLSPNWTLEYEFAKSKLYKLLAFALNIAKFEQGNPIELLGNEFIQETWTNIETNYRDESLDGPNVYSLFKPINNGSVSKAICAQYLAEAIAGRIDCIKQSNDNFNEWVQDALETDPNIKYLADAIKYVTTYNAK